jgi:CRP-like cAMP-binding protein
MPSPKQPLAGNGDRTHQSNNILAMLSREDLERVRPHLRERELKQHDVVFEAHMPIKEILFVDTGIVSLVAVMSTGNMSEIAVVGAEGVAGLALFHRMPFGGERAVVQVAGSARSLSADVFNSLLGDCPSLEQQLHRFAFALYTLSAWTSACNRRHRADQRLARWLLLSQDRIGGTHMPLTHQFMAQMLGVRRSTVTVTAEALRGAGLIHYRRGKIEVRDREGLEERSCECYGVVRAMYAAALEPARASVSTPVLKLKRAQQQ